jgi:hypothetical protein
VPSAPQPIATLILPQLPLSSLPRSVETIIDETAVSGERIIPLNGNWTYVAGDVTLSGGCPPQMAEAMQMGVGVNNSTSFVDFGGESFEFETWFGITTMGVFGDSTYSNPTPNQYRVEANIEGTVFIYDMTILSETQIEGQTAMDFGGVGFDCQITMSYTVTLDE